MGVRIFAGFDSREAVGWHVFNQRLIETTGCTAIPLTGERKDGSNAFTYARFTIPEICHWSGWAIFVDGTDMLPREDLSKLWDMRDKNFAVQVVKHDYKTKHRRKYLGTPLEVINSDYPRKNWSSVVIWNCGHMAHFKARDQLRALDSKLHRFNWLPDNLIGELPQEWNHLVGEDDYNPHAKLVHYTLGIPAFHAYRDCDYADEWWETYRRSQMGMAA